MDARTRSSVRTALAALVLALSSLPGMRPDGDAAAQTWRTISSSRQVAGETELDVRVTYTAGRFEVRPLEDDLLYRMSLRYDEEAFEPLTDYENGRLRLGLESLRNGIQLGRNRTGGEMTLELAPGIATRLALELGAVRADLDLGGISLTELELSSGAAESRIEVSQPNPVAMEEAVLSVGAADFTARDLGNLNARRIVVSAGVGDLDLDFGGSWRRDARVTVDMALGSLTLRFPRGVGVRLEKDTFLTSLDSEGLIKRGDAYLSPDWDSAEHRIEVDVSAAFGSIRVEWSD